jgi:excinuclease UvrABC nuclease subunit
MVGAVEETRQQAPTLLGHRQARRTQRRFGAFERRRVVAVRALAGHGSRTMPLRSCRNKSGPAGALSSLLARAFRPLP